MFNRIGVIGIGSIGSHVAKYICDSELTKELFIIDYDKVELRNVKTSIFKTNQVEQFKVDAFKSIIKKGSSMINVQTSTEEYEEGVTEIPECDILIDCRDIICDRGEHINVRLFASGRYLCVDCKTNVKYFTKHEPVYTSRLSKIDLKLACLTFVQFLEKGLISKLISTESIYLIDIDKINREGVGDINSRAKLEEMIIDTNPTIDRIRNIFQDYYKVIDCNKKSDTTLTIYGEKNIEILRKEIPKQSLNDMSDIIKYFSSISLPSAFGFYFINVITNKNNELQLNLLPEVGAA